MTNQLTSKQRYTIETALKDGIIDTEFISIITKETEYNIDRITIKMATEIISEIFRRRDRNKNNASSNSHLKYKKNDLRPVLERFYNSIEFDLFIAEFDVLIDIETFKNDGSYIYEYSEFIDMYYAKFSDVLLPLKPHFDELVTVIGNTKVPSFINENVIFANRMVFDYLNIQLFILNRFIKLLINNNILDK